jgi:hypothetical protein
MDFTAKISIQVAGIQPNGSRVIQFIIPPQIGVPGGEWNTHKYSSDGLNGRYPIFSQDVSNPYRGYSVISVRSQVVRNYTLGDFFAVWGQPLGPKDTVGLTAPPSPGQTGFGANWTWDMCVQPAGSGITLGHWGSEIVTKDLNIILLYSDQGCA